MPPATPSGIFGSDAFSPAEIADRVEQLGVAKARLPLFSLFLLGLLAGGFIALGAMYYTLVASDSSMGFAAKRVLGGGVFSLGLLLVVVAGAELFTGNNLLVMAWADRRLTTAELLRNWGLALFANFLGAFGVALLVLYSGHPGMNSELVREQYVSIAQTKLSLPFANAFFSGVLCNALVCLAVWMAQAGRSVIDKAVAILFPVSAFVAAGFEHCVANMYLVPMGILLSEANTADTSGQLLNWSGFFASLLPVVLGNIAGGSILVATIYYLIYKRNFLNA
ncbi:MAG: formate/nitrite transporter family protein [Saprospiraceae bacterium]|nr:formate/nitrite transporter family protein [Saprospiraceae bacterium]